MCGASLSHRQLSAELGGRAGVEANGNKISRSRLRWHGCIEQKDIVDCLKGYTKLMA